MPESAAKLPITEALIAAKKTGIPLAMLTAYDYPSASIAAEARVDFILVGDSGANVVLGLPSTRDIGMTEMLLFVGAVRRGAPQTHIVGDMPWNSDRTPAEALENARRLVAAGATSVKIEGEKFTEISAIVEAGIPVVGHLGLLPQTATSFRQRGKEPAEAQGILTAALELEHRGICALVVEHIPTPLGKLLAESLEIPVIGIGAGPETDGQVLVFHDALDLGPGKPPPISRQFAQGRQLLLAGARAYVEWVRSRGSL